MRMILVAARCQAHLASGVQCLDAAVRGDGRFDELMGLRVGIEDRRRMLCVSAYRKKRHRDDRTTLENSAHVTTARRER